VIMTDPVFNRASPIPIIGKPFPISKYNILRRLT
jgi:hypothetical protein